MAHPKIAQRWDAEIRKPSAGIQPKKVYGTGSPVAHKNMTLDPTGYVNREINKGKRTQRRAGLAKKMIQNAAKRRASAGRPQPKKLGQ